MLPKIHIFHFAFCLASLILGFVISFCFVVGARQVHKEYSDRLVEDDLDNKWRRLKHLKGEKASMRRLYRAYLAYLKALWNYKASDWMGRIDLTAEGSVLMAILAEVIFSIHS